MTLVSLADVLGTKITKRLTRTEQKNLGQYMTPPIIAETMSAKLCDGFGGNVMKILDPAAGGGILAAAVVSNLIAKINRPTRIELAVGSKIWFRTEPSILVTITSVDPHIST